MFEICFFPGGFLQHYIHIPLLIRSLLASSLLESEIDHISDLVLKRTLLNQKEKILLAY